MKRLLEKINKLNAELQILSEYPSESARLRSLEIIRDMDTAVCRVHIALLNTDPSGSEKASINVRENEQVYEETHKA